MSIRSLLLASATLAATISAAGCSAPPGDADTPDGVAASVASELVGGSWVSGAASGVVTGYGGGLGPLAVCRSPYDGGLHPGKLWQGRCNFGWGDYERQSSDYTTLIDAGYHWVNPGQYVYSGYYSSWQVSLPMNAVDGGDAGNKANHVRLGVCQAWRSEDRTWHPGKFFKNMCNIAWGGREIPVAPSSSSDVLVLVK